LPEAAPNPSRADHRITLHEVIRGLLKDRLIDAKQAQRLKALAAETGRHVQHPLVLVAEQNLACAHQRGAALDLERLTRWLAGRAQLPYLRIDPMKIDVSEVTSVIKRSYAQRFNILPVAVSGKRVTIATAEPWVREWESELSRTMDLEFHRVVANPLSISRYLGEFYAIGGSILGAQLDPSAGASGTDASVTRFEQLVNLGDIDEVDPNHRHVVRLVDWLLQYAFEQRASDIHLEPRRETGNVRFRIDGVLHLVNELPARVLGAVISRLKALGRLDVIEKRRPQDGRIKTKGRGGKEIEMRLSTMPTTFGEKLVMRIFDPEVLVKSPTELGFDAHDQALWEQMVANPHGMVVVTGPTGSGKTTTLYSALKRLARPELNVCTIEDPIEMVDPQFNQMYVQHQIGLDFATGVRTVLRQDPDIIMVGEIRDYETAETAVQAALTGHLVLTTLHTNDAPSSVIRFLDLGVAPYLLKSSLLGIVAQRLVRTLCPRCREPTVIDAARWHALTGDERSEPPTSAFTTGGCDECRHTGYKGRTGVFEILVMDPVIAALVQADAEAGDLRRAALAHGMRPLRVSCAAKVAAGSTTFEEVMSVLQLERARA
jgi:general secretion pathway protein E